MKILLEYDGINTHAHDRYGQARPAVAVGSGDKGLWGLCTSRVMSHDAGRVRLGVYDFS